MACHRIILMKIKSYFVLILLSYVFILIYMVYRLHTYQSAVSNKPENSESKQSVSLQSLKHHTVEIWGKAAIGNYLWEHIFSASLKTDTEGSWKYGEEVVNKITFRFRTGPGVIPSQVPQDTENLVIILNGREKSKIDYAQMWLNYLPAMDNLKKVALVILGDEECKNGWLTPYLSSHGGFLLAVFLIYDSIYIDNGAFFQWPLGVATYRNLLMLSLPELRLNKARAFRCNFLGTIYPNSSREILMKVISHNGLQKECFVKPRYEWLPQETEESREVYTKAILNSDLTLNPVGKNTECYRIYEAMSYGSVPVIEDIMTPGECGKKYEEDLAPLRLLKQYNAPVIYVKSWSELPQLLAKERVMSVKDIVHRRKLLVKWYLDFKEKMKESFINVINKKFFLDAG